MKYALCFLSGALMVSSAVVWASGRPGMFLAGAFAASVIACASVRSIGLSRVAHFLSALDSALLRAATPGPRKTETANVVAFQKAKPMFDPTQQDVISALVNLGIPMKRAEKIVDEVSQTQRHEGFDSLLRACLPNPRSASA